MTRWRAVQVWFGQWRQRVWGARATHADKRAEWWRLWTQRRLP